MICIQYHILSLLVISFVLLPYMIRLTLKTDSYIIGSLQTHDFVITPYQLFPTGILPAHQAYKHLLQTNSTPMALESAFLADFHHCIM